MGKRKHWFWAGLLFILILILVGWSEQVQSQEKYPSRPIDMICPSTAGASSDLSGRVVAHFLNKKWGVPVNVVNKPGGNYIPGSLEVYNAAPNGYTVLTDAQALSVMLAVTAKNLPFKILDRTYIALHSTTPMILFVPSTSPFKILDDLIAEAKKNPENISYTSLGGASGLEYAVRQLFNAIGVDISKTKAIACRGGSEAVTLAAGGHVTLGSASVTSALPAIKGGSIRPLFVTSKNRYPDLPDVPSSAELGYPMVNIINWNGISGPPKLPSYIVRIWERALEEIVKDPEFISKLKNVGLIPYYYDSQTTTELVKKEIEEVSKIYK